MNQHAFLTDEWFAAVKELVTAAGNLEVPPALAALSVNVVIEMPDGTEKPAALVDMVLRSGHLRSAATTMYLETPLARKLFIDGDNMAGLFAFMSGDMRVEGDVSMMGVIQGEAPSPKMRALAEKIREVTGP